MKTTGLTSILELSAPSVLSFSLEIVRIFLNSRATAQDKENTGKRVKRIHREDLDRSFHLICQCF